MPSTLQSIVIDAPIDAVWAKFNNFHDMSWSKNVVTKLEKVGDIDGSTVGAKRILNDAFHETLRELNASDHVVKYSIDDGPSPVSKDEVSNYVVIVKLSPAKGEDGTLVEWSSSWESTEDAAVDFCQGIYVALLGDLKDAFST